MAYLDENVLANGEHNFNGGTFDQQRTDPVLAYQGNNNLSDGSKGIIQSYLNGTMTRESALKQLQPLNQPIVPGGPQVNYGQGNVPFTGTFNPPAIDPASFYAQNFKGQGTPINSAITQPAAQTPYQSPVTPKNPMEAIPGETRVQYEERLGFPQTTNPDGTPTSGGAGAGGTPQGQIGDATGVYQMTKEQKQVSDIVARLQGLNTTEAGKATFTHQQEQNQGIPDLTNLVNDLSGQLRVQSREAYNITATQQPNTGVTSAIDARQRAEALRLNNIKTTGIQAALEAAKGNLATAQTLVDKAVNAQFDPIEANIKALTANIELAMKDPAYTTAEKQQLAQQQAAIDARKEKIAQQKTDSHDIFELSLKAIENGASADTIKQIQTLASSTTTNANAKYEAEVIAGKDLQKITYETRSINGREVRLGFKGAKQVSSQDLGKSSASGTTFGTPGEADRSIVMTWIGAHPKEASKIDKKRLETDPEYFYWVKNKVTQ